MKLRDHLKLLNATNHLYKIIQDKNNVKYMIKEIDFSKSIILIQELDMSGINDFGPPTTRLSFQEYIDEFRELIPEVVEIENGIN